MMEHAMAQRNRAFSTAALSLTHPNAAGIDIGSASHFVAVPPGRDEQPVREFASFTADLERLADWLTECGVDTVAMESTGVYWIALLELLDARGFKVLLVNARHVKNVSGRKSDVLDCQWLQQLMSYGLARAGHSARPSVCASRVRCRVNVRCCCARSRAMCSTCKKALTQMNIQLANVISDVVGETGQKILRAIAAGERDDRALAQMKNVRVHASAEEIAKSLQGSWRAEHLFALKQALDAFDFCATQLAQCDTEIEAQLRRLHAHDG
ncbi:MAG: IS110 family transposase, partial [Burkholderiales bacterium]|nr:IS110 family transposase [Burkholderiales bacterium]